MRTSGPSSCTQSSISDSSYSGDRETLVAMLTNLRSLNRVGQKETEKAGPQEQKKKKKKNLLGFCVDCVTKHFLHGTVPVRSPVLFIRNIKMDTHVVVVSL